MLPQPLIEKIVAESEAKITFDVRRCLRSRFNKNICTRCLAVCRSNSLKLQGRQIRFNAEKCTSCLQCVAVCPNDAFMHPVDISLLMQLLSKQQVVVLTCGKGIHNHKSITVPCIGFLSEPLLAAMNHVIGKKCVIDISRCSKCVNDHCLTVLHENIQNLKSRMKGKETFRLSFLSDRKTDRRSFLQFVSRTVADIGKKAVHFTPVNRDNTEDPHSKKQIWKSTALQLSLQSFPNRRFIEKDVLLSYLFSITSNQQCDCCPSCTGMCPTGALQRKKEPPLKSLVFTSNRCSGCGLCIDFCRKSALTLKDGFSGNPDNALTIRRVHNPAPSSIQAE